LTARESSHQHGELLILDGSNTGENIGPHRRPLTRRHDVVLHQAGDASPQVAERLNRGWRASSPRTTLSIGVAVRGAGDDPADTLARADAALYRAKRTGRDRVCHRLHRDEDRTAGFVGPPVGYAAWSSILKGDPDG
jgi:Diguanylate cyclase, GGDEF domain